MAEFPSFERYRIVLRHEYSDGQGDHHEIEEPLAVEYTILRSECYIPVPTLINEMMDKLKFALLDRLKKEDER